MSKSQKDSVNDMKSDQDSLSNKQLLNRKKKRDSNISSEMNEINSVHNTEIRCSICLGEEKLVPNCYKCITCSSYFHIDCYNFFSFKETKEDKIDIENIDKFECYRCKEEKKIGMEIKCYICKVHKGIIKKLDEEKYLHHYCYVFFQDNLNNLKGGVCKFCSHKKIPVLKCHEEKCKVKCHIQCAIDNNIIFWLPYMREEEKINEKKFNNRITFLCDIHNMALITNFNEYSATMLISKNDKNEQLNESMNKLNISQDKNNDNINSNNNNDTNIQKNIEDNNPINIIQKKEEIDKNNNNNKNNNEEKNNESNKENKMNIEKEEKTPTKERIIHSVINVNIVDEIDSINKNVINEEKEKDKNNFNENTNANKTIERKENKDSLESSPKTPVKIDLSKNNKISKAGSNNSIKALNSSNTKDILNATVSKDKNIDDDINISINMDMDIVNNEKKGEDDEDYDEDEDLDYKPPEIKHENIDLFENFKNKNEKYILPAAFNKFHF